MDSKSMNTFLWTSYNFRDISINDIYSYKYDLEQVKHLFLKIIFF